MNTRLGLILFVCILLGGNACASDEFPAELIGFLKPGMKIGVDTSWESLDNVEVHIWSDERFALELDAKSMKFEDLVKKYPAVAKARDELLAKGSDAAKPIRGLSVQPYWISQYTPMIVTHVGADYVLLQFGEHKDVRVAISKDRVSAVRWGMNQVSVSLGHRPVSRNESE